MRNVFRVSCASFLLMCAAVVVGSPAWAEVEKYPDKLMLRLGGYQVRNADFIGRLDANNAPIGTYVDFKETLGGEDKARVFRLDGTYRFNEHHGLGFSWYDVKFTGSKVLGQDITWNGVTYLASTPVDSELRFDVIKFNYRYSLFHNEQVELGASAGLHILRTSMGIDASSISQSENIAVTAPLPVFGLFANYQFTPRFSTFYNVELFFINYQDIVRGRLLDFLIGAEYRLTRHVALGAAYNSFAVSMKAKGDNATLYIDGSWTGAMLFGTLYF